MRRPARPTTTTVGPDLLGQTLERVGERGERPHFSAEEVAALLYAIVTINGWNRLAVSTHMVYEP